MVATRHSLPTTTSFTTTTTSSEPYSAEPTGSGTYSKKQLALLKQLNIDAKDAILDGSRSGGGGGGEDGEEKQVYHYRGESPGENGFMPANNPAPFSVAEIKENRAQMAVNEVLQLAAINSRIHILAQQHKKMRQELEVLRHERETHSSHESDPSKSLEIPDSEGSFTDPIPARRSTTTTTSPTEDTSPSRKEDTTTATTTSTTTTRSLSTSSSTSSYATATSPRQPTPISHAANPGTKTTPISTELPPPLQQPTVTSSPPTKTSLPPSQHLPSSSGPTPLPRESRKGSQKKTWSFLTDLQRGVEEGGEYDRAE
ncbi:hypothetical protein KC336_g15051, partial [Hortaea werneckii]